MKNIVMINTLNKFEVELVENVNDGTNRIVLYVMCNPSDHPRMEIAGQTVEITENHFEYTISQALYTGNESESLSFRILTDFETSESFQIAKIREIGSNLFMNKTDNYHYTLTNAIGQVKTNQLNAWPVGSVYTSVNNVNPTYIFGGIWEPFATGRTLVGVDTSQSEFSTVRKPGGHKALQSHSHTFSGTRALDENAGSHSHGFSLTAASKTLTGTTESLYTANQGNYSNGIVKSTKTSNRQYKTDGTTTNAWKQLTVNATHSHSVTGSITAVGNHQHYFTPSGSIGSSGGGNAQNLQPYITVYFWERVL